MYAWSEDIREIADKRGIKVDCVDGPKVIQNEILSRINSVNHNLIILNGHGDSRTFYGYENSIAIGIEETYIFKDKIVFARACNCAVELGKEAVESHSCSSFIGYKYEFYNVRQPSIEANPREDYVSRPIWESSNEVPISLIKGFTVEEAVESSHKKSIREISKMLFSEDTWSGAVLRALVINDDGLIYHGDGSVKIF